MFSSSNHLAKEERRPELVALIFLCSCCRLAICVPCFFLVVPWVGLWFAIMAFPGHTHLFLVSVESYKRSDVLKPVPAYELNRFR